MTGIMLWALLMAVCFCAFSKADTAANKVQKLVENLCREYASQGYPNSHVPVEGYCNIYVQCGVTNTLSFCPVGSFFNSQSCVDSSVSYCPYDPCIGRRDGYQYSDRETCHGFFVCMGGMSFYRKCYNGYRFTGAGCTRDSTCRSRVEPVVSGCDDKQYLASPDFPGVYFQRLPGGSYLKRPCPEGLVFDTSVCVCNYPENYYKERSQNQEAGSRGKGQNTTY